MQKATVYIRGGPTSTHSQSRCYNFAVATIRNPSVLWIKTFSSIETKKSDEERNLFASFNKCNEFLQESHS